MKRMNTMVKANTEEDISTQAVRNMLEEQNTQEENDMRVEHNMEEVTSIGKGMKNKNEKKKPG
jgi:aspartokinase